MTSVKSRKPTASQPITDAIFGRTRYRVEGAEANRDAALGFRQEPRPCHKDGGQRRVALLSLALLAMPGPSRVKEDLKQAGHEIAHGVKEGGKAIGHVAKEGGKAVEALSRAVEAAHTQSARILEIEDECIQPGEHCLCRIQGIAVKTVHGQACQRLFRRGNLSFCPSRKSMFRAKNRYKFYAWSSMKKVDGASP